MSDLAELFSRDPRAYSTQDIDAIIEHMRSRRIQFNAGAKSAGNTKPKTEKQKETLALADQLNIDL